MSSTQPLRRPTLIAGCPHNARRTFRLDVAQGLTASPKRLSSSGLYDCAGSLLFEKICEQPEYYPTRAERSILLRQAATIAEGFPGPTCLVELGSGSSDKTRHLIEAFRDAHGLDLAYQPIDISRTMLEASADELQGRYPELEVTAFAGDYTDGLQSLPRTATPRLVLWLGSSIGNLGRREAADFLGVIAASSLPDDRLLIGIDLRKDGRVLERAYDDARGVTARFSLNMLVRINRELGGHFDVGAFRHRATYLEEEGMVKIQLVSQKAQTVRIGALELEVDFEEGETIHTESSIKYSFEEIEGLVRNADFKLEEQWLDDKELLSLNLLAPA
jgi:L-histidine N-alpha-methyltransferase